MKLVRNIVLTAFLLAVAAGQARAQFESVGVIDFPTSATGEVQDRFLRGVAILHSFGWLQAREQFHAAQKLDPDFAMALLGESRWPTTTRWSRKWTPPSRVRLCSDWHPPGPSASPRRRRIARRAF